MTPAAQAHAPDELELVFLLAGTEARRAELRECAREVLSRTDFDRLERELAERRLLPLIGSRALEVGGDLAPPGFHERVRRALAGARANGLAVEAVTRHVVHTLTGAGIAALPLKGPLLAADAHGDIGLRETADVDILVRSETLDAAVSVLGGAGFSVSPDLNGDARVPDLHVGLHHPRLARVEVHWRVHWYEARFSEEMLARAAPGPDGALRATAADLAASLLLFYARDGFQGIRLAADLASWWERSRHELRDAFLEGHARRYPELGPALTAAAAAAERLTGAPATAWLGTELRWDRRVSLATRLADWTQHGDRDQLRANISLVDWLLGPRGSTRAFLRRELVRGGAGVAARALHGAKLGGRYTLAVWRVRGARRWAGPPAALGRSWLRGL